MTKSALLGAAALLSAMAATPVTAQEVIYNPGYCAQFYPNANCQKIRDRTIPIPAITSSGTRCAVRMPGAPVPARRARSSIAAATAAATIATDAI
jgi:hypothetical protein